MSSSEHISSLPAILPFLCTDSSEAPDYSDGPPSQDPYVMTVARWRSKVASRPSSSSKKRVRPFPARRLAWRHASPRSSDHHSSSSSSSSYSSPVHSSGLDAPDQAHFGSSTRDVSPRLGYPPRRAPRQSSSGDSSKRPLHSSSHSAGPSRKRCRSLIDSVPLSTPVMGSLAPTRADLLPPRKRFRDSYSSEASIEENTEIDPIETEVNMELGIGDGYDVRDHVEIDPKDVRDNTEEYKAGTSAGDTVEVGIDPMSAPIVEEIVDPAGEDSSDSSDSRDGIVRSFEDMPIDLDDVVRDFYRHMSEVSIDKIVRIETVQRRLEADQLIARGQREEFCQVRRDRDDTQGRLRRNDQPTFENRNDNGGGNGNGNGNNGGDNGNGFKGTEGVVGLVRWSEKMETVFHISNCSERYQVKYATCTLLESALTWWNSHMRTIGTDAAYDLSWRELLKLIQKMETELWNLSVKNNDMATYTQRFQELTMMCTKMVPEEEDQAKKFIGGLPDNI
ncbi:reverse transcriptase domain-containing protein [Tanacetum coccineum]